MVAYSWEEEEHGPVVTSAAMWWVGWGPEAAGAGASTRRARVGLGFYGARLVWTPLRSCS